MANRQKTFRKKTNNRLFTNRGAVKRCQGCRQVLNVNHFIDVLLIGGTQIVIFSWLRLLTNFFWSYRVPRTQKRLKNTVFISEANTFAVGQKSVNKKNYSL